MIGAVELANLLGYLIGFGSLSVYTPLIYRIIRKRSAKGLATTTWLLKCVTYGSTCIYSYSRALPLSAYMETISTSAQAFVLLLLVSCLQVEFSRIVALFSFILLVGGACLQSSDGGKAVLSFLQGVAIFVGASAVLPQILLNWRHGSSGEFSILTASLLTVGNLVRAWTTIKLAGGDPLLLVGFGLGFLFNGFLLAQILYYSLHVEKQSLSKIYMADCFSGPNLTQHAHHPRTPEPIELQLVKPYLKDSESECSVSTMQPHHRIRSEQQIQDRTNERERTITSPNAQPDPSDSATSVTEA
eukprot:g15774.t1